MDKDLVRKCDCVGWEVYMYRVESGGFRATIKPLPETKANTLVVVHGTNNGEKIPVTADTLDALEKDCIKVIRKKEELKDYEVLRGWQCRNCVT